MERFAVAVFAQFVVRQLIHRITDFLVFVIDANNNWLSFRLL